MVRENKKRGKGGKEDVREIKVFSFVGVLLACLMPLVAGAFTIDFDNVVVGGNQFFSPYYLTPGFVTEDFNSAPGTTMWTWAGNGQFKTGSSSTGAAPAFTSVIPDPTKYVAVPLVDVAPKTAEADLSGMGNFNYFGLWWGSADWAAYGYIYNELRFYSGATLVQTVTANDVYGANANGNWYNSNDNSYVNIYGLPNFDKVQMYSSTFAFEADNMTVGVVPEPATMILFGLGLLGLAGLKRRLKK